MTTPTPHDRAVADLGATTSALGAVRDQLHADLTRVYGETWPPTAAQAYERTVAKFDSALARMREITRQADR